MVTLALLRQPASLHSMRDTGPVRVATCYSVERITSDLMRAYDFSWESK
jgi:hypothetical protein